MQLMHNPQIVQGKSIHKYSSKVIFHKDSINVSDQNKHQHHTFSFITQNKSTK